LPEYVENKITNRTKALILNSPNNPTGCVLSKKNLHKISEICKENKILVISDEIYEPITYRVEHCSIASFDGMKDITVVVNGFSKAYSMTGWRLGYAAGPEKIIKAMTRIQAHSVSNPTSFVQVAGEVALKSSQACVKKMVDEFRKRRDVMLKMLNEIDKVSCVEPKGTFYAFPNFSYYEKNSLKLANYFLESARVAVVPGEAFGDQGKGFIRLSYATSMENIVEGMERIKRALKKLR
jgi:aspartate aminotransferase